MAYLQLRVATGIDFGTQVVGSVGPGYAVTADTAADEFALWQITDTGATQVTTVAASVDAGPRASMDDCCTYAGWTSRLLHFFTPGSPWTANVDVNFSLPSDPVALFVSGDKAEAVLSTDSTVYGLPMDGTTTANWSCSLGTGLLIGSPSANRWLRLSGDLPDDGFGEPDWTNPLTIDMLDDTGSILDTITFVHPRWSWYYAATAPVPVTDSFLQWITLTTGSVMYLGKDWPNEPTTYELDIVYRLLDCTGDALSWTDAEQVLSSPWTDAFSTRFHPSASSYAGQLAIGYTVESFT